MRMDLNMLVMKGDRERPAKEFEAIFAGSSFRLTRVAPTKSPVSLLETRPAWGRARARRGVR